MRRTGIVLASIALLACGSSTQLSNMWVAPDYKPHPYQKVLVVALVNGQTNQRAIEDDIVKRLSARNPAVPSYQLFPDLANVKTDEFKAVLQRDGIDGILVIRTMGKDKTTTYTPGYVSASPYGPGFWGTWDGWYGTYSTPGYYTQYDTYSLETSFFDLTTGTGKLVWSGTTETTDPGSVTSMTRDVGDKIVEELKKRNVIS